MLENNSGHLPSHKPGGDLVWSSVDIWLEPFARLGAFQQHLARLMDVTVGTAVAQWAARFDRRPLLQARGQLFHFHPLAFRQGRKDDGRVPSVPPLCCIFHSALWHGLAPNRCLCNLQLWLQLQSCADSIEVRLMPRLASHQGLHDTRRFPAAGKFLCRLLALCGLFLPRFRRHEFANQLPSSAADPPIRQPEHFLKRPDVSFICSTEAGLKLATLGEKAQLLLEGYFRTAFWTLGSGDVATESRDDIVLDV